jgi:sugar-specific transcriptional regulator TrmB
MQYLESLKKIGLNDKEQAVLFSLLQLGKATANQIAAKSQIKRPTTYDILYRLQDKSFIYEADENGKRYFIANPPKKLVTVLESQKRALENDLPILQSIYNINPQKPKVAYFEGFEGIKQLYEDTLTSLKRGDEILAYVTHDTLQHLENYSLDYVKRRVAKGITLRGIYQNTLGLAAHLAHDQEQMRISKTVEQDELPLENEINIYANKMIVITYAPEPYGILIESNEVANTQRSIFEMAWRGLK